MIYPGVMKVAAWGECRERQARSNLRRLEDWGVLIPIEYRSGGRRSTRFVVSGEALFRALVKVGCNPSPELRAGLTRYDLTDNGTEKPKNPAVGVTKKLSEQALSAMNVARPKAHLRSEGNPAKNPAMTAAGIHREPTGTPASNVLPFPPSAARCADASLFLFSCRERGKDALRRRTKTEIKAFRRFLRVFPRRLNVDLAQEAFFAAVDHGADPEAIVTAAARYGADMEDEDEDRTTAPTSWLREKCWEGYADITCNRKDLA
ncbi:MAG: hypothetical protein KGN33_09505 [Paracoccaceae bacterium]|nr:hypothetical protein [Paracoccaceae bacterium]